MILDQVNNFPLNQFRKEIGFQSIRFDYLQKPYGLSLSFNFGKENVQFVHYRGEIEAPC